MNHITSDERILTHGRRGRWSRFSIRTMLIVVTVLCVILAFFVAKLERARRQSRDIAALKKMNVRVWYDFQSKLRQDGTLDGPDTLKSPSLQPEDFFYHVTMLRAFDGVEQNQLDQIWNCVGRFPRLQSARVWSSTGDHAKGIHNLRYARDLRNLAICFGTANGADWSPLNRLRELRFLNLAVDVDDSALEHLRNLQNLKGLSIRGKQISERGLSVVAGLTGLQHLDVYDVDVTDGGLSQISKLPNLKNLTIWSGSFGDGGVQSVAKMTSLEDLTLRKCNLSDDGVAALASLKKLADLTLDETAITDNAVKYLISIDSLRQGAENKLPVKPAFCIQKLRRSQLTRYFISFVLPKRAFA